MGRGFWIFFTAAFFFDAGFSVYFFLFNLYLLDFHFNEKAIGLVNGALTLGALVGTLPVGALGRRIGLRPVLLFCFVAAPLVGVARAFWMWEPAQIGLAFLAGMVMCTWTVSFLPAVASLTTEKNRTSAISLIFSVGVGTSALGGAVSGYLPQWLRMAGFSMQSAEVKRLILLASCALAAAGMLAVLRLRLPAAIGRWGEFRLRVEGRSVAARLQAERVSVAIPAVHGAVVGGAGGVHSLRQRVFVARSASSARAHRTDLLPGAGVAGDRGPVSAPGGSRCGTDQWHCGHAAGYSSEPGLAGSGSP